MLEVNRKTKIIAVYWDDTGASGLDMSEIRLTMYKNGVAVKTVAPFKTEIIDESVFQVVCFFEAEACDHCRITFDTQQSGAWHINAVHLHMADLKLSADMNVLGAPTYYEFPFKIPDGCIIQINTAS